ncbi:MAG: type II toxin-antitoxin system RelE/ParE family toxin [Nitrospiria bacterium]
MIKTFADQHTQILYETGRSKRLPSEIWKRALRRLEFIDLATRVEDLKVPPSNRLHKLRKDRKGQHAIAVNEQWRICFRFSKGDAYEVEITDYH